MNNRSCNNKIYFSSFLPLGYTRSWHLLVPVTVAVTWQAPSSHFADAWRKYRKLTSFAADSSSYCGTKTSFYLTTRLTLHSKRETVQQSPLFRFTRSKGPYALAQCNAVNIRSSLVIFEDAGYGLFRLAETSFPYLPRIQMLIWAFWVQHHALKTETLRVLFVDRFHDSHSSCL
jgi:hypothetical protein